MGKYIDRAVLTALGATACYIFFLNAWHSIPLACLAAFAACALTRLLILRRPRRRRPGAAQVMAEIMRIACLSEEQAGKELTELMRRRYPGERFELVPVLKHPEASLSSGDILSAWKANREAERLVIAATCPCEPRAALYAQELNAPAVAVVDSRRLARLLKELGSIQTPAPPPRLSLRQRLRRVLAHVSTARVTIRDPLFALVLLAVYLFGGSPACLFAALAMLAHCGVALLQRRTGRRLFS